MRRDGASGGLLKEFGERGEWKEAEDGAVVEGRIGLGGECVDKEEDVGGGWLLGCLEKAWGLDGV